MLSQPPASRNGASLVRVAILASAAAWLVTGSATAVVRTDASIRATVAAGEQIIAATRRFERDHHDSPRSLSDLVPRYLTHLPVASYGDGQWRLASGAEFGDERRSVSISGFPTPAVPPDGSTLILGVQLVGAPPGHMLVRQSDGCWRLPALGRCWQAK
jgi:hypothetical protein